MKMKKSKRVTFPQKTKCDGCGKKFAWSPDRSVNIHVSSEAAQARMGYMFCDTTRKMLRHQKKLTKQIEGVVKRSGDLRLGLFLQFCSVNCLMHFGREASRQKLARFGVEHARTGLVYSSSLSIKCKDPIAILRLMRWVVSKCRYPGP